MTQPGTGGQARSVGGLGIALLVVVLAAGAWFVLAGRAPEPERSPAERAQPGAEGSGPELAPGAPRPGAPATSEPATAAPTRTPTWRLEGRVTGAGGDGVAGAKVVALLRRGATTWFGPVETDREGHYAIDFASARALGRFALAGATLRVAAWADGHAPAESDVKVEWPAARDTDLALRGDLVLPAGELLRGRVVTGARTPVADAEVAACDGHTRVGWARTRADGGFVLERPPASGPGWTVVAMSTDHGWGWMPLPTAAGEREVGDVVLEPGPAVEGIVVFADGSPVGEAVVTGTSAQPLRPCLDGPWGNARAVTRADGRFRILLPRDGPCFVRVEDDEAAAACLAGDRDVRLVVRSRRVRLRVVDAEGRPLPGLGVLARTLPPQHAGLLDDLRAGRIAPADLRSRSDFHAGDLLRPDGTADFWTGPGTGWLFDVDAPGAAPAEAALRVPAEGNETEVRVVLREQRGGGHLALELLDPDGKPVPLARVTASTALGSDLFRGPVAAEARLGPFPAGLVRVDAHPIDKPEQMDWWIPPLDHWLLGASGTATIAEGATTRFTLRGTWGGRLRVTLRAPGGAAPTDVGVRAVPQDGSPPELLMGEVPGQPGHFSSQFAVGEPSLAATLLATGTYRIEATFSGKGWKEPAGTALAVVRAREVTDVTVDLTVR